eukprot:1188576-Prorocentrum_minimum.AAC.3
MVCRSFVCPIPSRPLLPAPQQYTLPPATTAHVWASPHATPTTCTANGRGMPGSRGPASSPARTCLNSVHSHPVAQSVTVCGTPGSRGPASSPACTCLSSVRQGKASKQSSDITHHTGGEKKNA